MNYNLDKFKGVFSALLTPFDENNKVNKASIEKLIEFNIKAGINGFYVGGSTGESMVMDVSERKELMKYAIDAAKGRVTMIAHIGAISTDMACDMAKYAETLGYDAVSAVAPFYYSFPYEAIKGYYNDIMAATKLPMIIYNFPASGSFSFNAERAEEIIKNPQVIAIKHTSQDLFLLEQFKHLSREVIVYNGYDEMLIAGLSMGADGGIGSTYNFMPDKYVKMFKAFKKGDLATCQAIQDDCNRIICKLIKYGVFQSEKAVLTAMGIPMGNCRKPFLPISAEGKKAMEELARELQSK